MNRLHRLLVMIAALAIASCDINRKPEEPSLQVIKAAEAYILENLNDGADVILMNVNVRELVKYWEVKYAPFENLNGGIVTGGEVVLYISKESLDVFRLIRYQ